MPVVAALLMTRWVLRISYVLTRMRLHCMAASLERPYASVRKGREQRGAGAYFHRRGRACAAGRVHAVGVSCDTAVLGRVAPCAIAYGFIRVR